MPSLPPIRRLGTLQKSSIGRPKPTQRSNIGPKKATVPTCCESPKIEEEDGRKVCVNCFTQIEESNIVAEVSFQEDNRGAAQVQGGVVGDGARFARSLGSVAQRRVGGGERDTAAQIDATGRRQLAMICPRLGVTELVSQQAGFIWSLAAKLNFTAGRRTDEVIAACLYAACRRQSENSVMLMDLTEIVKINVFRLGEVYKDLVKELYLEGGENPAAATHLVELEPLIMKYCRKLEFGEKTRQVCEDALKIVKRMKRDWINTGRHPAGLCGACIILAARMNNFRRTVREVVYVAKVADVTIAKRVEEFRRTRSAAMTVEQFRSQGYRLKHQHDPPAYYLAADKMEKWQAKKRKRQIRNENGEIIEADDGESQVSSRAGSVVPSDTADSISHRQKPSKRQRVNDASVERDQSGRVDETRKRRRDSEATNEEEDENTGGRADKRQRTERASQENNPNQLHIAPELRSRSDDTATEERPTQTQEKEYQRIQSQTAATGATQNPRRDAEGFAIPTAPASSNQGKQQQQAPKKKRGRPRKHSAPEPPQEPLLISEEELAAEAEIEDQIESVLQDTEVIQAQSDLERAKMEERAKRLADEQRAISVEVGNMRRDRLGIRWKNHQRQSEGHDLTEQELADEFDDDPEVIHCCLRPDEQVLREKMFVAYHEDWLRTSYEKGLMERIAEAQGYTKAKRGKGGKGRKKKGKKGEQDALDAATPIETPGDASAAMLAKRAQPGFSKYVNYDQLVRIYGERSSASSRAGSEAPSANGSSAPVQTPAQSAPSREPSTAPTPPETEEAQTPPRKVKPTPGSLLPQEEEIIEEFEQTQSDLGQGQAQNEQRLENGKGHAQDETVEEEDEEEEEEEEEEIRDDDSNVYGDDYDDREDIGEDDYERALDPEGEYGAGYIDDDW